MSLSLGSEWIARELPPPDAVLERDPVTAALLNIRELLETLILREQSPVQVVAPPLDLSSLRMPGPLSASEIGAAVASAITFPEPPIQDTSALEALLKAMEKLDFRMKGTGGGGSLSPDITDRTGRLLGQVTNLYADTLAKTAYCTTLSSAGDHTVISPASGNRIRLLYVTFTPSSDNTNANLVRVGYGTTTISTELYRGYAAGHGTPFEGTVNQSVVVNTGTAEPVALTLHYAEIT